MSERLIKTVTAGNAVVKVYFESDFDEYRCHLVGAPKADYFTGDKDDALATATAMAKRSAGMTRPNDVFSGKK